MSGVGGRGAGQYGSSMGSGNVLYSGTSTPQNPGGVVGGSMDYFRNRANMMPTFLRGPAGQYGMSGSRTDPTFGWGMPPSPPDIGQLPFPPGPNVPRTGGFNPPQGPFPMGPSFQPDAQIASGTPRNDMGALNPPIDKRVSGDTGGFVSPQSLMQQNYNNVAGFNALGFGAPNFAPDFPMMAARRNVFVR